MIIQIEPWINEQELLELKRVTDSTFVTEAALTKEFEEGIKTLTGAKHAIAMTNGTLALFCALKAVGIKPGDEVLVPDMTFIATANAVILAGAKPVFCDIENDTLGIDIDSAKQKISPRTKAIIPVHMYGQSARMEKVLEFAKMNGLKVVEDAAQGIGVKYNGKHVGTFGEVGILSFYGNKTITCGEGGIVLTNDPEIAKTCYRLKNHGRDTKGVFMHEHIGFNFSFTEMQAAVGIAQLKKLKQIISRKQEIRSIYENELAGIEDFQISKIDKNCTPVHWFTSYFTSKVEELQDALIKKEIQTRRFFYPLHLQPCYSNSELVVNSEKLPTSLNIYNTGISLPSAYNLTSQDQQTVITEIKNFYNV